MNGRSSDGLGAPRLVFPNWRIAREATLEELCLAFVDRSRAENLSTATQRYYRQTCERWLRFCAERILVDPRDVSPDHLTAYSSWLQAGGNNKQSVATWLRGVRALMSWAELRGYVELSPFRMWKLKQPRLPAQRGFGATDVRRGPPDAFACAGRPEVGRAVERVFERLDLSGLPQGRAVAPASRISVLEQFEAGAPARYRRAGQSIRTLG
jgi:hypothetical protein